MNDRKPNEQCENCRLWFSGARLQDCILYVTASAHSHTERRGGRGEELYGNSDYFTDYHRMNLSETHEISIPVYIRY